MPDTPFHTTSTRQFERFLAVIGTAVCLIVCARVWQVFSAQQPMWPFPDLYLLEMLAVSILGAWGVWSDEARSASLRAALTWSAAGALFAFAIMGAFSVGFWFIPVGGSFALAAILSGRRQGHNPVAHLGMGLVAAIAQVALMLVVIRFLLT